MLINSIPQSCNTALEEITASLPNTSKQVESGDICTSYCITPLKQAALECQDINNIYSAISSRCCWNDHNQRWPAQHSLSNTALTAITLCRCFSLSGHATIAELIEECGHYNSSHTSTGDNCTSTCSDAMAEATTSLGCCLPALLAGSSHQSLLEPVLWHWCIQEGPGQQCTRCSSAMATPLSGLTVLIVTTLTRQLI